MTPADFKEIIDLYQKQVYNLALRYVQQIEDAEEITQDVFVKVYEQMDQFKGQSQLKTWIYRITVNTSLDFLKSKRFKLSKLFSFRFNTFDEQAETQHATHINPQISLEQKEGLNNLLQAIEQLPSAQKTVIILLKVEQLSQKETAEIMQLSEKAVESLFQRAKKNLSKIIYPSKEN